jgi:hypothetical protein
MTKQQGWYLIGVLSLYFAYCVHPLLHGDVVLLWVFTIIGAVSFASGLMEVFKR